MRQAWFLHYAIVIYSDNKMEPCLPLLSPMLRRPSIPLTELVLYG